MCDRLKLQLNNIMTDYQEEQRNEIEAIESIYPEEVEIIKDTSPHVFSIAVSSQANEDEEEADSGCSCRIQFTYVARYPDEALLMEITESDNLEDDEIERITTYLQEQAEDNAGEVMVFTLVSALQERLTTMVEDARQLVVQEKERKERILEEEERKRFEGTVVTVESFLAWKQVFDAEMEEMKRLKSNSELSSKKLTGYELFMRDDTLFDSDVQFLQSADVDTVEVDESLFQDMEDFDLEEDNG